MRRSSLTLAVLSGKGGTGKTLVSANLAGAAQDAAYVDCDVEAPNGHLFFQPEILEEETVCVRIPVVDEARCTGCRACVDFCRFGALAFVKGHPLVFPSVCHACGGCALVCKSGAIAEADKPIGTLLRGCSGNTAVFTGALQPGEASGVPLIRRLLQKSASAAPLRVIDCPPGSACAVTESIRDADYCLLVAEPTVYGAQNLAMVHALTALKQKPIGVLLNKCGEGENPSETYCAAQGLPIVGRIAFDHTLGRLASDGTLAVRRSSAYGALFGRLLDAVCKEARHETAADSQR